MVPYRPGGQAPRTATAAGWPVFPLSRVAESFLLQWFAAALKILGSFNNPGQLRDFRCGDGREVSAMT